MSTKLAYTGVDYIRLTSLDHLPFPAWNAILLPELLAEEKAGRRPHNRWIMGYYGRVGEHCFLGKNDTGCMVHLSGALAWSRWYDVGNHSDRCTRLDLQVTYPVDDSPGLYVRTMYEVGQLHKVTNGRPPDLQLVDTPTGAKMLTVGSRQSQVYGRMYDKARESGLPEYANCVRWEIECKAETANDLNGYMRIHRSEAATTRAIVREFWERRGMAPFWETYESMEGKPPAKRSRTDETKLAWMATQVRPVLQTLTEHGKLDLAIRALFGEHVNDGAVLLIKQLLALQVES